VVTNGRHEPEAIFRNLGRHLRSGFDLEAGPDRVHLAIGRVDQGARHFADLAVGTKVFQGKQLLIHVVDVFAGLTPQLAIRDFHLSEFWHVLRPPFSLPVLKDFYLLPLHFVDRGAI